MVEGKSYTSSFSGRKLVSVPQESSSQTMRLLLGFNKIKELYCYEFMGWDGLWLLNILHNNISKITDYALIVFYLYLYILLEICLKLFYVFLYSSLGYLICAFGLGRYRK